MSKSNKDTRSLNFTENALKLWPNRMLDQKYPIELWLEKKWWMSRVGQEVTTISVPSNEHRFFFLIKCCFPLSYEDTAKKWLRPPHSTLTSPALSQTSHSCLNSCLNSCNSWGVVLSVIQSSNPSSILFPQTSKTLHVIYFLNGNPFTVFNRKFTSLATTFMDHPKHSIDTTNIIPCFL